MSIVVDVIAEHLRTNRRLVVPAFGAFVVKETGERMFSDLLRADDGVLASLLREKGLTEMEAAVSIDRFIFEVRNELEQFGYYRLGEVGTLRVEPDSGVLRLNPPVLGDMPKQTPFVPTPIVEEGTSAEAEDQDSELQSEESAKLESAEEVVEEVVEDTIEESAKEVEQQPEISNIRPKTQPRKKVDVVMVVAIVVAVLALISICYGLCVMAGA